VGDRLVLGWPTPPDRHLQGADDELGSNVIGDRAQLASILGAP
jgi:hypothetical protein